MIFLNVKFQSKNKHLYQRRFESDQVCFQNPFVYLSSTKFQTLYFMRLRLSVQGFPIATVRGEQKKFTLCDVSFSDP